MAASIARSIVAFVALAVVVGRVPAGDWPTYRADAARSGYSADLLPPQLELRWVYRAQPASPAWPQSARITFDFASQPILIGDRVLAASSSEDRVVALDAASGQPAWTFFTGGPVRFAPAAWRDRAFVASDDGTLYAISLDDGRLLWQHRGGPEGRKCLGNGRLVSRWPARGGPVVVDETVYYAAGIWPSDGIYLHALDAATGQLRWTNDSSGDLTMPQPHPGAEAASGVAPQGYLLATGEQLFAPTGRAVPAAFRLGDGQFQYYRLQENGSIGGSRAMVAEHLVINSGCFLDAQTGSLAGRGGRGVFSVLPDGVLQFTGDTLLAYRWSDINTHDRKGNPVRYRGLQKYCEVALDQPSDEVRRAAQAVESLPGLKSLFRTEIVLKDADANVARQTGLERGLAQARPDVERLGADVGPFLAAAYERSNEVIAAGREAVCGVPGRVSVVALDSQQARWSHDVDGTALGLAAAGGKLLVSTDSGMIYCFAQPGDIAANDQPGDGLAAAEVNFPGTENSASSGSAPSAAANAPADAVGAGQSAMARAADAILLASGVQSGICVDLACGEGELALQLAQRSELQIIGIERDPAKVDAARRRLAAEGFYGSRVSVLLGDPGATDFPSRCADLIVSARQLADPAATAETSEVQRLLRPWGGTACLGTPEDLQVQRRGPLDEAGSWTHQNADAANTLCSDDRLVRGPLEMAWYRDSALEIPDRHAQGPAPLCHNGYLVVAGVHGVCALDAYNGRTRWVYPIPDLLADWDGVHHDVGVGDTGSIFCLADDAVFVRTGQRCLKIDLASGRLAAEFPTPVPADGVDRNWGYVACADGLLFGSVLNNRHKISPRYADIGLRNESVLFFAMDPVSGEVRWRYQPEHSIRNNTIAIADGRVYLIDRPIAPQDHLETPTQDGKHRPRLKPGEHPGGTLLAFEAASGSVSWRVAEDIWGTQLAVSPQHDVLLMYYQGVKHNFFRVPSEVGGRMAAFATDSGQRLWDQAADYRTRPLINGDVIYAEGGAWKLASGESVPWTFERSYGCGQIAGSRNLMLFRSATLGYLDLTRSAGTENFGGIRPGCWFNAIAAGGLVLVPDGSFKCACSYQTQAWVALQPR